MNRHYLAGALISALASTTAASAAEQMAYFGPLGSFSSPGDNLRAFFVEARCSDPTATDPALCQSVHSRQESEPVVWELADWGSQGNPYYQIAASYQGYGSNAMVIQTWSYPPFGAFNAVRGDGGQLISVTDRTATIIGTQDVSTNGVLWFVGPHCGGQGWREVNLDNGLSDTVAYSEVNRLSSNYNRYACQPLGPSLDFSSYALVDFPFLVYGTRETRTVPTIISTHFDNATTGASQAAERSFYCHGYGRCRWEYWVRSNSSITPPWDLPIRCGAFDWGAPAPDYRMVDCRMDTQIVRLPPAQAAQPSWSGDVFGWGNVDYEQ